jgi:hypothetical protein
MKILASLLLHVSSNYRSNIEEQWQRIGDINSKMKSQAYLVQRDEYISFIQSEREILHGLISQYEEKTSMQVISILQSELIGSDYGERWITLEQTLGSLYLLYANWFLSGHSPYTLDNGQHIFDILEKNNIPLSTWQETILQSALRSDINPDAKWGNEFLFPA